MAEGGFERRDPPFAKIASWRVAFKCLVEIVGGDDSAELHAQVADEQQECDARRPPLGATRSYCGCWRPWSRSTTGRAPCEIAGGHHALNGPRGIPERAKDPDRRAREVARKSILVEESGATVLGGDVEVLRKGTIGDEACTFLNTNNVPQSVEVIRHGTRIRATRRSRVPGEDLGLVSLSPAAQVRTKSRTRRATEHITFAYSCKHCASIVLCMTCGFFLCPTCNESA